LLIELEGHGREAMFEDIDVTRTVGWFTTRFPVLLDLRRASGTGDKLKSIKEQLRCIPSRGIGYGLLRYLNPKAEIREKLRSFPEPEVSFNYLGQFDRIVSDSSVFGSAPESAGPSRSLRGRRCRLIEISGGVAEGQLRMNWTFSRNAHRRSTIQALADDFVEAVRSIIVYCRSSNARGYTPSDFPAAGLNQEDLNKLLARIGQTGDKRS